MNIIYVLYLLTIIIVFYNYNMINKPCYNKDNFQLLNRSSCNFLKNTLFGISDTEKKLDSKPDSKSHNIYNSYDLVSDIERDIESNKVYYWAFSCISQDVYINTAEINISKLNVPNVNIQIGLYSRETNTNTDTEFNTIKVIDKLYTITTNGYISLIFDNLYLPKPKEGSCYYLGLKIINVGNELTRPFKLWCKSLNVNNSNNPSITLWRKCDNKNSLSDVDSLCKTTITKTTWLPYLQLYQN
jgi:hypothetical protein